ncbi:ATP-binding protein [Streptosporangium sp. V21-05]|uniref:ATP-binding protein n=1 Tax=Streptosporangium sp. V21-05 TaxID=3446115 RepID=UPI003F52E7E9
MATFRARARAVDMLGRQQIAGIPTAINELFKNAHDAYAENVIGDYFRHDRLLVIRDDGYGMTVGEFIEKWLTVGTESKMSGGMPPPPGKPQRPVLGEKGIGRLAVAAIGPQVVVLSRSAKEHRILIALVNWTMFTAPGIDLDEVTIPMVTIPADTSPKSQNIEQLVGELRANLERVRKKIPKSIYDTVAAQCTSLLEIDPGKIYRRLQGPSLTSGPGTHFWITPTDEMLAHDISQNPKDELSPPPLLQMLVGFSETLLPGNPPPPMLARFYDHRSSEIAIDMIGDSEFFTPEDFEIADHQIVGSFDKFGQFSGTVSVYREPAQSHIVSWPNVRGNETQCGPFSLRLAYIQGEKRATRLSPEEFNLTLRKLSRVGGLYVYRDRVRVLPYGKHDFDWLDIERERSKSASDYFWSYRRMFGVISIDSKINNQLQEKAGREGFRANAAYRELRDILQNFLVQTARDFFREDSPDDTWRTIKVELEREAAARKRHDQLSKQRRAEFRRTLSAAEQKLDQGRPEHEIGQILSRLESALADATSDSDLSRASEKVIAAENAAQRALSDLRVNYRVTRPRGLALSKGAALDWEAYQREFEALEHELLTSTRLEIARRSATAAQRMGTALNRRRRLEAGIKERSEHAQSSINQHGSEVSQKFEHLRTQVEAQTTGAKLSLDREIEKVFVVLASTNTDDLDDQRIIDLRASLEDQLDQSVNEQLRLLQALSDKLSLIMEQGPSLGQADIVDVIGSLEQEVFSLRDRADEDLELAQLGLALQVINHEFSSSIRAVRGNLRRLRAWADANKSLRSVYSDLRASFEHLDAYLRLFTPLNKRLYRRDTIMSGGDVENFVRDLFQERLLSENISLDATVAFRKARVRAYPSTLYPVFVNLVDNAIFWLSRQSPPRQIVLDHANGSWSVEDNGPGIPTRDQQRIFELGFSRKPNGRGMGLHISRDVLRKEGWGLELSTSRLGGACFVLREPTASEISESDDEEIADEPALE